MKSKTVFSLVLMGMLLIPGVTMAHSPSKAQTFAQGNEFVTVKGNSVQLGIGGIPFESYWVLYQVTSNGSSEVNLNIVSVNRIINGSQDSVVVIETAHYVKVAEIYTFYKSQIDASIAITSFANSTATFLANFMISAPHQNQMYSQGSKISTFNSSSQGSAVTSLLSSKNTDISNHNYSVNWQGESNIYRGGIFSSNLYQDTLLLPFGPIALVHNETYSIDPAISNIKERSSVSEVPLKSISGMPDSVSTLVFNSNGNEVAFASAVVNMNNAVLEGADWNFYMATQILPYNSDGFTVNQISQQVVWSNDNYSSTQYDWSMRLAINYYQNHVNSNISNITAVVTALTDIANAFGVPIPNVAAFFEDFSGITNNAITGGYQVSANAGQSQAPGGRGYDYNPLGYLYNYTDWLNSYWFADELTWVSLMNSGLTYPHMVYDAFEYSVNFALTGPNEQHLYAGGTTITFVIGEYQYP